MCLQYSFSFYTDKSLQVLFEMFEKISMDTIEELSNGFMNKINGIRERLQGKEGVDDIHDDENRIPKDDGNTLKPNATVQHNLRKRKPLKYYSEINRKDPCDKQFGADIKKSRKDHHSGYRQPVLRNTNDHYVMMDFTHNLHQTLKSKGRKRNEL